MILCKPSVLFTAACMTLGAGVAAGNHIPGHEECDPTFPMPIPGPDFFTGGVLFVTLIGPVEDTVITNTTFSITYTSDGATPASDLQLAVSAMVDGGFAEVIVTGADLGFGSGPGTFTGTFQTDALNGVVFQAIPPSSIVELMIDAVGGGGIQGIGFFTDSFITFDVIPAPPCELLGACCHPIAGCALRTQSLCESGGGVFQGKGTTCGPDPCACPWDLDGSGAVGVTDLLALLAQWGTDPGGPPDFDGDGVVGVTDFLALLAHWGTCM